MSALLIEELRELLEGMKDCMATVSVEVITPQMAHEMMSMNEGNRPIRIGGVHRLAADMEAGTFRLTTDCIGFDVNGVLINGQHRLAACIKSGLPFIAGVMRNVPTESYGVLDTGNKRKVSDLFHKMGVKNYAAASAVSRVIAAHLSGCTLGNASIPTGQRTFRHPTSAEISEAYDQYADIIQDAIRMVHKRCDRIGRAKLIAVMYWKCRTVCTDTEAVNDFFSAIVTSASNERGTHPARVLRERFMASPARHMPDVYTCALIAKAWNAYRAGKEVTSLKWMSNDAFPEVAQ